jgi:hypothetical protein
MSSDPTPERMSVETAERVLAHIYGEDLHGCTVSLEEVASIIDKSYLGHTRSSRALIQALGEVLRNVEVLATPPTKDSIQDVTQLVGVLGERTDTILTLVQKSLKAIETLLEPRKEGNS